MKKGIFFNGCTRALFTPHAGSDRSKPRGHIVAIGAAAFLVKLLIGLMLLLLPPETLHAASFTVDNNCDDRDTTCGGGDQFIGQCNADANGTGSGGKCTLRSAIRAANALAGAGGDHVIFLKAKTYTLTETLPKIAKPPSNVSSSVTIQGVSAAETIIQRPCNKRRDEVGHCDADEELARRLGYNPILRGKSSEFRIFNVAPGATLSLIRVTVRNGQADFGAGINNDRGSLQLTESTVMGNTAHWNGGGIYNAGRLWLQDSTVRDNFVHHQAGGGIFNAGAALIRESTISGNKVADDGLGNHAHGGGIYNVYSKDASADGSLQIVNSTISGNTAAGINGYGGGIASSERDAWLYNVTITANNAFLAGGVYVAEGPPNFYFLNTIIAGNNRLFASSDCFGDLITLRGNLVGDARTTRNQRTEYSCNIVDWPELPAGAPHDQIGGKTIPDPISVWDIFIMTKVGDRDVPFLDNNGGFTCTHRLALRSSAINAAWPDKPGSSEFACEAVDQRGARRGVVMQKGHCDIGAYETNATAVPRELSCSGL
jgi:hypothetical protein